MPFELRKIIFEENEVYHAIIEMVLKTSTQLPYGTVEGVDLNGGDGSFLVFHYGGIDVDIPQSVSFKREQVAAALLAYCRDLSIPVPRGGQKLLKAENGKAVYLIKCGNDLKADA